MDILKIKDTLDDNHPYLERGGVILELSGRTHRRNFDGFLIGFYISSQGQEIGVSNFVTFYEIEFAGVDVIDELACNMCQELIEKIELRER